MSAKPGKNKRNKGVWTDEEKAMFLKGLEIFGRSWVKISELIPSRTSLQVKNYAQQHFKNLVNVMFETELHNNLLSSMLIQNTISNSKECEPDTSKQMPTTILTEHNYQSHSMEDKRPTDLDFVSGEQTSNSDSEELDIDIENDDVENPVLLTRSTSPTSVYEKLLKSAKVNLRDSESDSEQSDKDEEEPQSINLPVRSSLQANEFSGKILPKDETEISHKNQDDVSKYVIDNDTVNGVTSSSGELVEFPIPTAPITLNFDEISEEEQTIHSEFFDGRIAKTPDRYLKIRNHIIETWYKCRPVYLNKTAVRRGLKNCGDVNCIGRIHSYLECIGVINFGCELALYNNLNKTQIVNIKSESPVYNVQHNNIDKQDLRCRKRRIRDGMGEWIDIKDSEGKTIEHKDFSEEDLKPKVIKVFKTSYDPFKLIPCQKFTEDKKAPFNVEVNNSPLIVMDVHAHISKTEVIGMLGGRYDTDCGKLEILVAVPCTSLSTGMQCEMDPVSQTQASEEISNKGLKVVGWYHSHPTFSPNPSIRDIETQIKFQDWFSKLGGNHFVGIIVSPYNRNNQGYLSEVNCLTISQDICPQLHCNIPYEFDYKVVYSIWNKDIVKSIRLLAEDYLTSYNHIKLSVLYKQSTGITCLQKVNLYVRIC
ncbi:hypothetical protein LOTGIDRAFT_126355 [Lottia gigantea]|uniref:Myb-like, SWIRM and MPN domain-containing protein 1 n=1 Tax=Lottia gigantea TaxID=225164 RepID=V4A4U1_LOTGI|nr:hypothetical protein LOTGIDRAFT_126355 [Lottia gigantea]ESO88281.1 hypothetical protein LOTGIDRAFT_126355 [Lottia gigantea]